MNKVLFPALAVFASLLAGCASTRQFVHFPDQTKNVEDVNKGRIYVMRPATIGAAVTMGVTDGGKPIGATGPHGFLCWERQPGDTILSSSSESEHKLGLNVKANQVYYIFQHLRMGVWIARSELELVENPEEGKKVLRRCHPPKIEHYEAK